MNKSFFWVRSFTMDQLIQFTKPIPIIRLQIRLNLDLFNSACFVILELDRFNPKCVEKF